MSCLLREEAIQDITPRQHDVSIWMNCRELSRLLPETRSLLSVLLDTYTFDVSQATLESADGMVRGDSVSVIYEGQLTDTDTSTVRALKVVDDYHRK